MYRVDSTGDDQDASPGDNVCSTGAFCTLRAAIEEANAHPGFDEIRFRRAAMNGATITIKTLSGPYPSISGQAKIDGCSFDTSHVGPCVGLRTEMSGEQGPFKVDAAGTTIKGLAITHADTAINAALTADDLTVRNNWFGQQIDGSTAEPLTANGIVVTGDRARIGGEVSRFRNVFINVDGTALRVEQGDDTKVQGNYFGVHPDGTTGGAVGENIEVVETAGDDPEGTLIGGRVTSGQHATTKCDGVCNVISGATSGTTGHGIDLQGEGGEGESQAGEATIQGNFIGLDKFGTLDRGNAVHGIHHPATPLTIGGGSPRDRNYIGGNGHSGINGGGAVAKRNWIGLSSSGDTPIPDQNTAVRLEGGKFARNRVAGDGSNPNTGLFGNGAGRQVIVKRNKFGICGGGGACGFADDAIGANGDDGSVYGGPNPGDGNVIANSARHGLLLNGRNTTIQGNYIGTNPAGADRGNGLGGILVRTGGATNENNEIGGPGAAQNVISFNGGNAIELDDTGSPGNLDNNEIKHNRGLGNGDIFINLIGGANNGIPPPPIDTARRRKASGSGIFPSGAKVRVYKTREPDGLNRIDRFLCADTVGTGGNWSCNYARSVPTGALVTATVTDPNGDTSELAPFRTVPFP